MKKKEQKPEKHKAIEFAHYAATEERLKQAIRERQEEERRNRAIRAYRKETE